MIKFLFFIGVSSLIACTTWLARKWLLSTSILDIPNMRSNHENPTPSAGGIAFVDIALICWAIVAFLHGSFLNQLPLLIGAGLLSLIGFFDDIQHIKARWRLLVQILAVALGLYSLNPTNSFSMPLVLLIIIIGFIWIWFINLTNFMDGIDGITCSQMICMHGGIIILSHYVILPEPIIYYAIIIASVSTGFLLWNKQPAAIFMGDTGSLLLGCLSAYLLLELAFMGYWVAALLLPAYYLADSGITLARRIIAKEPFWEAHSKHFYQLAVRAGATHSTVVWTISFANILLVILSVWASTNPQYAWNALIAGSIIVGCLLYHLAHSKPKTK